MLDSTSTGRRTSGYDDAEQLMPPGTRFVRPEAPHYVLTYPGPDTTRTWTVPVARLVEGRMTHP